MMRQIDADAESMRDERMRVNNGSKGRGMRRASGCAEVELLCREELRGLGVHLVLRALECGDAEEDEAGEHGDLEDNPECRPYVRRHSGVHDVPLCRVRVVGFAEVLVVRDVPWIYLSV